MIDWARYEDHAAIRAQLIEYLAKERDRHWDEATKLQRTRTRTGWTLEEVERLVSGHRRISDHYQQAIDLLTAAPMPAPPLEERVAEAVRRLRARGIDAHTATGSAIGVRSRLSPVYCIEATEREMWTAEQIADDIEQAETGDAAATAPMPEERQ